MESTTAATDVATCRLIDLAGTKFLTVTDRAGRQASAPVSWADLLTPDRAAARIERVAGVQMAMPTTPEWARFVFDAWCQEGGR